MPRNRLKCPSAAIVALLALGIPLSSLGASTPRGASTTWSFCDDPPPPDMPTRPTAGADEGPIYLSADFGEAYSKERFTMWGNAEARRGHERLLADLLTYDKARDVTQAHGNIHYSQDGLLITGHSAYFELLSRKGKIEDVEYRFVPRHARGAASSASIEGKDRARLKDVSFTTCSPGNHDWYLRAKRLRLDRASGTGSAQHAWLTFKGVPLLYTPYITFPIDDRRRSGFLAPSFGTSNSSGVDFSIPYYWNIAPNLDATTTPRLMSKRGFMLRGEFRYLNPTYQGQIDAEYLPFDQVYEGARGLLSYRHQQALTPRLRTDINLNYVSDHTYFTDLGNTLSIAATAFLERRADLVYTGPFWSFTGRLQGFETLDETVAPQNRPYQRLPQFLLSVNLPDRLLGLDYLFNGEAVHFDRDTGPIGERADFQPTVRLPFVRPEGYLTGTAKLRSTQYRLQDTAPGIPQDPNRTLPIMSLDSGMFFERDLTLRGRKLLQTLEPRLYYLYVPFHDQSRLPVFDTALRDLTFSQLFQDNRFIGADRVGDANQLTLALTTRLLDETTGVERLRASIGQIQYFEARRVTLPNEVVGVSNRSDVLGELTGNLGNSWATRATVQWSPDQSEINRSSLQLRYRPTDTRLFNIGYRVDRTLLPNVEQTDVAVLWPVATNWNLLGRWNYSLADHRNVEALLGFEYNSCCWALRLAARHFITDVTTGGSNNSLSVQLELKGLTRFGNKVEDLLERGFLGY